MVRPRALVVALGLTLCALVSGVPVTSHAAGQAANQSGPQISWIGQHGQTFDPANGPVHVQFKVNQDAWVKVRVYKVGKTKPVYSMFFSHVTAGKVRTFVWYGKNKHGKSVRPGKYFVALKAVDTAHLVTRSHFGLFTVQAAPVATPAPTATASSAPSGAPVSVPAAGKHIVISLSRQTLYAYDGKTLVLQTYVTTGNPSLPTPAGDYSILNKQAPFEFISPWPYGSPYWYPPSWSNMAMLFRSGGYYIHDAPWRSAFGPGTNGPGQPGTNYGGTHGCVNVPEGAMSELWNWTPIGTAVFVVP
jgi:lipoprotein-anchoring transpeptidase ErfK/SrfK